MASSHPRFLRFALLLAAFTMACKSGSADDDGETGDGETAETETADGETEDGETSGGEIEYEWSRFDSFHASAQGMAVHQQDLYIHGETSILHRDADSWNHISAPYDDFPVPGDIAVNDSGELFVLGLIEGQEEEGAAAIWQLGDDGWIESLGHEPGRRLVALTAAGPRIWALGFETEMADCAQLCIDGQLIAWFNDANGWVADPVMHPGVVVDALAASPDIVYVAAATELLRRDDQGWSVVDEVTFPGGSFDVDMWATSPDDVWLTEIGPANDSLHFDGNTWTTLPRIGAAPWGTGPTDVYGIEDRGRVQHYDGNVATPVTPWTALYPSLIEYESDLVVTNELGVGRIEDGQFVTMIETPGPGFLEHAWGTTLEDLIAPVSGALVRIDQSELFGWKLIALEPFAELRHFEGIVRALDGTAPDNLWIATDAGLWHWDGAAATQVVPPAEFPDVDIADLHRDASDGLWLVGSQFEEIGMDDPPMFVAHPLIMHLPAGASDWELVAPPTDQDQFDEILGGGDQIIIGDGSDDDLFELVDGAWQPFPHYEGPGQPARALRGIAENDLLGVMGDAEGSRVIRFQGEQWSVVEELPENTIVQLWGSGPDRVWMSAHDWQQPGSLRVFRLDPDDGWIEIDVADELGDESLRGIAVLEQGAVISTTTGTHIMQPM